MVSDRYLRFAVRYPPGGRPLLWPVRVWKVLYPTKRVLRLNLFQQAILGLARARCEESSEIAELLGLDGELVAFIIAAQLIPNGWMTTLGTVTAKGERDLEEAEDASEEVRMGYAYQDAISGHWIPRFTEELPEIEAKRIDERGFPVFLRDLDSGKEDRPFRLSHNKESAVNIGELFDAFQKYRMDHDHAKQRDDELPTAIRIESLNFVEDTAQPMWLWTWIFPDQAGPQPWLVADPFGLQPAVSWLRKPLQDVLPRNDAAARYIAGTLGTTKSDSMSAEEWLRSLENQIDLTLLADYSWSRSLPAISGYLTSVLRRSASLAAQDKPWQEDVTSLLIETHNLAESVFQWLLKKYPIDVNRLPDQSQDKNWTKDLAIKILRQLPVVGLPEDTIRRLKSQNLREIRNALVRGNSSLKALIFASLVSTIEHTTHPLRDISAQTLALDRILDMADARNRKAGHAANDKISKDEAMEYAELVIEWIQIFKGWY